MTFGGACFQPGLPVGFCLHARWGSNSGPWAAVFYSIRHMAGKIKQGPCRTHQFHDSLGWSSVIHNTQIGNSCSFFTTGGGLSLAKKFPRCLRKTPEGTPRVVLNVDQLSGRFVQSRSRIHCFKSLAPAPLVVSDFESEVPPTAAGSFQKKAASNPASKPSPKASPRVLYGFSRI
jgi:hypothetical protein